MIFFNLYVIINLMEKIISELNEEQQKALLQIDGAVLVTAGAGSGKTRLLTHRIAYLISNLQVSPYNILAITFTNKAAKEMKDRVEKMIEGGDKVWISTFHSMCAKILRMDIDKLGDYDHNFSICSDQDTDKLFKQICAKYNIDKDEKRKNILFHINNLKNNNMSMAEYKKMYDYLDNIETIEKVYYDYQSELRKANALDFNDLMNVTYELFSKCPEVLQKYAERFRYVLVDEFQDTNTIQYELVKLLTSVHKNIFVVGDEDQCIYTWRGANFANIFEFQKDFSNVKFYKLERNYRSTKKILNLANKLIKNNKSRMEKVLWTDNSDGAEVLSKHLYDEKEEAEAVAREIYDLVNNHGYKYSDFAVLMRLNALTLPFEERFLAYNIPHRIYGGFKFYERAEIKNLISYLRLFANPRDDISFERVINFPKRGIGESALNALKVEANNMRQSLLNTVLQEYSDLPLALSKKFESFKNTYLSLQQDYDRMGLTDFVKQVIKEFNIKSAYNSNSEEDINRLLNIDMFIAQVEDFEDKNHSATLVDFLESVSLISDIDGMDNAGNCVTIATVHSVKGLEFRYVFIIGLEEKIFPISRAFDNKDEMEEERRLMYVAITRAKENLMLSSCKTRYLYGKRDYERASRFLREIDLAPAEESIMPEFSVFQNNRYGQQFGNYSNQYQTKVEKVSYKEPEKSKYDYNPQIKTKFDEYVEKRAPKANNEFEVGQTVLHPKFGVGKIISIDGGKFADIDFGKIGVKSIMLEISPLKVLK